MRTSLLLVLALTGCARDLRFGDDARFRDAGVPSDAEPPDPDAAVPPMGGPHIDHAIADGAYLSRVDATHAEDWVYLDLDTGLEVNPGAPGDDALWDLAFRRSNIAANGGVSGTGGVEVAQLAAPFADVHVPPTSGFLVDRADGDDEDTIPDYALRAWYLYDSVTHILSPADVTYVVRTTDGAFVKLRIVGYYDEFGTSGRPSFRWQTLP